ncbi:hypothetical protein ACNKHR_05715 [Shigella flexneri]
MYFNIARILYCRSITFSVCSCCFRQLLPVRYARPMTQITNVFGQVRGAFPVPD